MEPTGSERLRSEIERALRGAFDPADVLPRLARLARLADPASEDAIFANQKLAELLVDRDPWRAALYVRRAIDQSGGNDDRAWAVLAFCQTLLGNFRCAASAYKKAIACAPSNPWYAHNLGHLLDVALGQPAVALDWLKRAYEKKADNSEIVASYVHALARAGRLDEARAVLEHAKGRFDSRELDALLRWLDQGAPSKPRRGKPTTTSSPPKQLARILTRGLSHLPLDPRQRERALALARDALPPPQRKRAVAEAAAEAPADESQVELTSSRRSRAKATAAAPSPARTSDADIAELAAAVAYAIVYVDHVPLSQAEVAAPFRVGVAHLRGRFAELRAKLDIIRGDARYATTRR
jgi:tetratricopeptide (TPR) repeat protein